MNHFKTKMTVNLNQECPFPLQAMKVVSDRQTKEAAEKQQLEKELSKIKIAKDDVDLIVSIVILHDTCTLSVNSSDAGDGIFRVRGPIPSLLMPWRLKEPGHQQ